jgi:hypothetical protein
MDLLGLQVLMLWGTAEDEGIIRGCSAKHHHALGSYQHFRRMGVVHFVARLRVESKIPLFHLRRNGFSCHYNSHPFPTKGKKTGCDSV